MQIKYSAFKETFNANIIQQNLHYWVEALQIKNRFSRKSVTFQMSNKRTNATTCILRHTVHVLEAKILNTWVSNCSLLFYCVRSSITDDLNNNATCLLLLKWLFVVWNTAVHLQSGIIIFTEGWNFFLEPKLLYYLCAMCLSVWKDIHKKVYWLLFSSYNWADLKAYMTTTLKE